MRVFISWSKPTSRVLASALRDWLPDVIQQVKPWMSQEDVPKGERWLAEIATQLDEVNHGIACVTRENAAEPWLNFEAGALAKSLTSSRLWTLLLDLSPTDVTGPLTTFQATSVFDEGDMLRFIMSLNDACEHPLEEVRLKKAFDRTWPEFAAKVTAVETGDESGMASARSEADMLAETLERVRAIERAMVRTPATALPVENVPPLLMPAGFEDAAAHLLPRGARVRHASGAEGRVSNAFVSMHGEDLDPVVHLRLDNGRIVVVRGERKIGQLQVLESEDQSLSTITD